MKQSLWEILFGQPFSPADTIPPPRGMSQQLASQSQPQLSGELEADCVEKQWVFENEKAEQIVLNFKRTPGRAKIYIDLRYPPNFKPRGE